jgi:hypothetical protein
MLVIGATAVAAALALGVVGGVQRAAGLNAYPPPSQPTPQAELGVPAEHVMLLGASPREPGAPGANEVWGVGQADGHAALVRYYVHPSEVGGEEGSWTDGPALPAGFAPEPGGRSDPLEGQIDSEGYGVLAGTITPSGTHTHEEVLLVRKPGGAFEATASPSAEGEGPPLGSARKLWSAKRVPMFAPLHEEGGEAGALVAPVDEEESGAEEYVLHWDSHKWTREPIAIPGASTGSFRVLALAAESPTNAWLLARLSVGSGQVALFHRIHGESGWTWKPVEAEVAGGSAQLALAVPVSGGGTPADGEPLTVAGAPAPFPEIEQQILTVTEDGVWVDGERTDIERATPFTSVFVRPGSGGAARIEGSWCNAPPGTAAPACLQGFPQEPPRVNSRSIAWPGAGFGTRVITGLPEGVTLSLSGSTFGRVLSLGGGRQEGEELFTPGAHFGAAFSSPTEGWLGESGPPIHLTESPRSSRLQPWPVAFRHPLIAIAPEPGAAVGALGSEAIAIGENGAVARYEPRAGNGVGAWIPESLFGPGERIERANLDAVAWPSSNRVYAVGSGGEMWLWRGETGFWERDPATPINFQDNLLGIAFDPGNPALGYAVGTTAVGQGGVILRYGKTWTEEPVPAEVANAGFTAVGFAGGEALVAYSRQLPKSTTVLGGLLVNSGSGWAVDGEAAAAFGEGYPQALATLPDGGAAVLWHQRAGGDIVFEREGPGTPWQAAPGDLSVEAAGSLSLFREGGRLRALVSGGSIGLRTSAGRLEVAPGFPPVEGAVPGVTGGPDAGSVLRQTADGWSDQRHEADNATQPSAYSFYDAPYRPDPIFAMLPEAGGTGGWAVGGEPSGEEVEQTADIERYSLTGDSPVQQEAPVALEPESHGVTTYAFGGNAQCEAPCSDRAFGRVEPQVALSSAVQLAAKIGVPAFFDTGPTITANDYAGTNKPAVPYEAEFARAGELLGSERLSGSSMSVFAAATQFEVDEGGLQASSRAGFPGPFGAAGGLELVGGACACGAYALAGPHVITVVLDDSHEGLVEGGQREWLEERLQEAGQRHKPAIVVGNADLGQQLAPGQGNQDAELLFAALTGQDPDGRDPGPGGGRAPYVASAYFYDSAEQNIAKQLTFRGRSLPVFGSGTLGYESPVKEQQQEFHGAKGILLGEVVWGGTTGLSAAQQREYEAVNRAAVRARLVPVVGELALEAQDGLVIPRSHPALFAGLARKPRAGCRLGNETTVCSSSEGAAEGRYVPIPSICVGQSCGEAVLPEYEFTSSRPDIGGFVEVNTASNDPRSVLQNASHEPIKAGYENPLTHEQLGSRSALFCAYNKGETVVGIRAGGLSYSLTVQVQAGSVRQPCGTVPVREKPETASNPVAPPPPPTNPAPAPAASPPPTAPPPVPPLPAVPAAVAAAPAPQLSPFIPLAALTPPLLPFVPPPLPTPARPTPPSGTSAVTSPVQAVEREEEEEEATESVSNQAAAYRASEHEPVGPYILGIVLLAAFAGASVGRGVRRRRRGTEIAFVTVGSSRQQRRLSRDERRRRR